VIHVRIGSGPIFPVKQRYLDPGLSKAAHHKWTDKSVAPDEKNAHCFSWNVIRIALPQN